MQLNEIWFYQLNDHTARNQFVLRLCELSDKRQRQLVIYCPDQPLAETLDDAIWAISPIHFLAHTRDNPACLAPIQIVTQHIPEQGDIVLNLAIEPLQLKRIQTYQRLIEIILPNTINESRLHWKSYLQQGIKPELKMI